MSRPHSNPLEHVLRLIAAMSPRPWYPRVYARDYGESLDDLNEKLRVLWDAGLVVKADSGSPSTGAGLQLSLAGVRLLEDPEGLRRLGAEQAGRRPASVRQAPQEDEEERSLPAALPANRTAQKIRAALSHKPPQLVTRILLVLNVGVFLIGLALAYQGGGTPAASAFFIELGASNPAQSAAQHNTGSVTIPDLLAGQWWRLLTCCFVHFGILHLGMNMYVLFIAGRNAEFIWGWWRYVLVYLLSGLGGAVLGVVLVKRPINLAGASGALCGILAAELVWVLLNGRYLPADLARRWRASLIFNAILITLSSVMMPGVSWQDHLGGAVVGAAVGAILNVQRFGVAPWRWLVLGLLLLVPVGGWVIVDQARAHNPVWTGAEQQTGLQPGQQPPDPERAGQEEDDFGNNYLQRIGRTRKGADRDFEENIVPLLERHPQRRPQKKVEEAIADLEKQRTSIQKLAEDLGKAGPYNASKTTEKARVTAADYMRAYADFLETTITCLRDGKDPRDVPEYAEREKKMKELRDAWKKLLE